jgi:lipopolysaccharide biosynthesis regulator YciM
MLSAGWLVVIVTASFLIGYGARAFLVWWHREEEREDEDFYKHFGSALTHLAAGRSSDAIDELTLAARQRSDIVGVYLILGDLYRERGQFDRAVRIHSSLRARGDLTSSERAQAYTSLGEDHLAAGLGEQARESFRQALALDPRYLQALKGLSKFAIEDGRWEEAADLEEQILRLEPARSGHILGHLYYEMGLDSLREDDEKGAQRAFQKAIAVEDHVYPAHLFLGDLQHKAGRLKKARERWEKIVDLQPRLLHLVYDRLEQVYAEEGEHARLEQICHRIAEKDPGDWRVRVLLGLRENDRGNPDAAYKYLLEAARVHPNSVSVQRELWRMTLERGLDSRVARELVEMFRGPGPFTDPFGCTTCRFRSQTYLWRCPRCHGWSTFADEASASMPDRTAPALGAFGQGMSDD